jgi:hypothetical protein
MTRSTRSSIRVEVHDPDGHRRAGIDFDDPNFSFLSTRFIKCAKP